MIVEAMGAVGLAYSYGAKAETLGGILSYAKPASARIDKQETLHRLGDLSACGFKRSLESLRKAKRTCDERPEPREGIRRILAAKSSENGSDGRRVNRC